MPVSSDLLNLATEVTLSSGKWIVAQSDNRKLRLINAQAFLNGHPKLDNLEIVDSAVDYKHALPQLKEIVAHTKKTRSTLFEVRLKHWFE